jgi:hypothetical protein
VTTTTITGKITDPTGGPLAGVTVVAVLDSAQGAYLADDSAELSSRAVTVTGASGTWSLALTPNAEIEPAGTGYRITRLVDGQAHVNAVTVPVSGSPVEFDSIVVDAAVVGGLAAGGVLSGYYPNPGFADDALSVIADSDLLAIAALTPANDDVLQRKSGAWANRTLTQLTTDLRIVDVVSYGAVGDGVTDDTAAVQAAVNATLAAKGTLRFPARTYRITAPILMGSSSSGSSRWSIEGVGATLLQATGNTPILRFTKELTYLWTINGLNFAWAANQTSTQTGSVAILFDSDTNDNNGFYNFTLSNLRFQNGFRGISVNEASVNTIPVWGADINHIHSTSEMSGAAIRLRQTSAGQPNLRLTDIYVRGDAATETLVDIQGASSVVMQNIEFNQCVQAELLVTSCESVEIGGIRSEAARVSSNFIGLWTFSDARVRITGIMVQDTVLTHTNFTYIVRGISTNTYLTIGTATVSGLVITGGGQVALVQGDNVADIQFDGGFKNSSSITKIYKFDNTPTHMSRDRGVRGSVVTKTANYTATATDDIIIGNGSSITLTLPSASATATGPNRRYTFKNKHSSSLTVASNGGLIDGAASASLTQWAVATYVTDGTDWLTC